MQSKIAIALAAAALSLAGCSKQRARLERETASGAPSQDTVRTIAIDGSSTVFPISEAVAEEFQKKHSARVTVGASGTGGGFKKFCAKETAIAGASRPIKPTEVDACREDGVEYIELPVAYDGIAVVVHPENTWVDHLTVDELKSVWAPESAGQDQALDRRPRRLPKAEMHLFGPGVDSGTYDYFTRRSSGTEHAAAATSPRAKTTTSWCQGVATDSAALGFFGFAYYEENKDKLKLIPIDDGDAANGAGPIAPSPETVDNGTYQPLARPIFIYVSNKAAETPEVQAFVDFYLTKGRALVARGRATSRFREGLRARTTSASTPARRAPSSRSRVQGRRHDRRSFESRVRGRWKPCPASP